MRHARARHATDAPISIYEVHAGSWFGITSAAHDRHGTKLTDALVPYVGRHGVHPCRAAARSPSIRSAAPGAISRSACSRRARAMARPKAFARFVDACHGAGIGVILDWVPAHFPTDAHGLARFDGTALYEHLDPREGFHRDWNTYIYNFGRREVQGFLIASALLLAGTFPRRWAARRRGGLDAVSRLQSQRGASGFPTSMAAARISRRSASCAISMPSSRERCPGAMTIAEESTAWPGVTRPICGRRPRLLLQVEHGLDARHAALHGARSDPSALASQRHDVRPALRIFRATSCCRCHMTRWSTESAR